MFGVMWSEHCCYRNSRPLLKQFPTSGPRILVGPGENAEVVDLGDNQRLVFKIESHNHPSAIEPFQGAATGVGGILRDVFTMEARPVVPPCSAERCLDFPCAASSFYCRGRLVGLVVFNDNEGSGSCSWPWIGLQGLRKTAHLLRRNHLVAHETPCHSLLFGGKDHLVRESYGLFKPPLHSRDSVGKLGARIGHFPVDKRVLELPGPFCFTCYGLRFSGDTGLGLPSQPMAAQSVTESPLLAEIAPWGEL